MPRRLCALIVEDEPFVALDLKDALLALGFDVCGIALNQQRARSLAARAEPDIAVMDVCLEEDGQEAIEVARWLREVCRVHVVFVTANADKATLEQPSFSGVAATSSSKHTLHHHQNTQEAEMKKLASAAVLLLFVSASTLAQPPSETPQPPPSAPEAAKPEAAPPSPPEAIQPGQPSPEAAQPTPSTPEAVPGESVSVTEYYKQNVYDASDNAIGEVSDVLLDKDGHVTAMILSVGGFLGLGAKYVSVPFNALRVTEKDGKRSLVMDTTKDALMSAPGYQYDKTKGQWVPETKT